ncbi:MAG: pilus assembly PilX N-terminal domain-containing protein [Candidatus Aminicenantes bacterium]|nr:pilus assembly PilX N-terminal domain-containing protein [Candidatus Aminicenantes bacterium]
MLRNFLNKAKPGFTDYNLKTLLKYPKGSGLIAVILVLAFMLTVGVAVLTVTSSGPKISATMRYQEEAFNAAEAGFDAARIAIEDFFGSGQWSSFGEHYLTQPTGIDIPFLNGNLQTPNPLYFRRLTDEQILNLLDSNHDGICDYPDQVVFFEQPFVYDLNGKLDQRYRYTVFLIDDEAGTGQAADPRDVLMVCIGVVRSGPRITDRILATCRLEIEIETPEL